jgi:hypothetical protein
MHNRGILIILTLGMLLAACTGAPVLPAENPTAILPTPKPTPAAPSSNAMLANVTAVNVTGNVSAYTFSVTISSPDTGCDQYADWWEVLTEDGTLLYRRILAHSHVGEQPFTRSGGPVNIDLETPVWVRAHLSPGGYGGAARHGSVTAGFSLDTPPVEFGAELESESPQPDGCAF